MRGLFALFFFLLFHSYGEALISSQGQGFHNQTIASHSKVDSVSQIVWPALTDSSDISEPEEVKKKVFLVSVTYPPQPYSISSVIGIPGRSRNCAKCTLLGSHTPRAPPFFA